MKSKCFAGIAVVAGALLLSASAPAQDFSAQGISHGGAGNTITSKVFASGGKVRIESQEENVPAVERGSYSILDLMQQASYVVNPGRKTVLQQSPVQARTNLAQFNGDPCAQRNQGASNSGTCGKAGTETINGRSADRYEVRQSLRGQPYNVNIWVDARLHIVLKMEMNGAAMYELRDVHEGPQPAALFEIPADYQKVTLQGR